MSLILGIDEAGRGPVIGPMVIAGVAINESNLQSLRDLKLRDSKKLSKSSRDIFYDEIKSLCDGVYSIHLLPVDLNENLTIVERDAIIKITAKFSPSQLFVDAPVPPKAIPGFVQSIVDRLTLHDLKITAENGADDRYEIVSAASIIAKVERDREIEKLWDVHGDFGCGYPSDPKTQNFLRNCYLSEGQFPECVRIRWATVDRVIHEVKQQRFQW